MEAWQRISILLCTFGFFREMRPVEPFNVEYLTNQYNITSKQLNKDIYPLGSYSVLVQLVIIFLVTDMLRYKPIIVFSALGNIVLFAIVIWTQTFRALIISRLFYGTLMASEVAYYTYIYAKVEKDRYKIVTVQTRAAFLCGKFMGAVLGQVLLSTGTTIIRGLAYISFGSQVMALCVAIVLPSPSKSLYFYTDEQDIEKPNGDQHANAVINQDELAVTTNAQTAAVPKFSWHNAMRLLVEHTMRAYSKPVVVQWSIWWALATSVQLQAVGYVQFLWKEIDPNHESFYNGAVEAAVTLLGAVGAMAAGLMSSNRHKHWHWWILTISSLLMGTFLIISSITNLIIVSYVMYILFGMVYYFVITIASATVAENLDDDSFGLIFGINGLAALVIQSLLTVFVVTDTGLGYGPRDQFIVYGEYYLALACLYCVAALIKFILKCSQKRKYILE